MAFSNVFQIIKDLTLYLGRQAGLPPTFDLLPQIAQNRWPWFCAQWQPTLKRQIFAVAAGDEQLTVLANRLQRDVATYNLGATAYNPFASSTRFAEYQPLLASISLTDIQPDVNEQLTVNLELQRIGKFTLDTFLLMRSALKKQNTIATQEIGLGDADANRVTGLPTVLSQRSARTDDYYQLQSLFEIEETLDQIIYDFKRTSVQKSPNLLAAANANITGGSAVRIRESWRTFVGVPFYQSLEVMAQRYMGSTNLWYELVTVNNLQAPYVDESGIKYLLKAPGAGLSLRISSDAMTRVRVGAKVRIGSLTKQAETRFIDRVVENLDTTITLYLSGEPTLASFKTTEQAYVRAFAPDTVNSDSFIKIPLDVGSGTQSLPAPKADVLKRLDNALRAFGVDALRAENTGDLLIDSGDFALSYGIANVRQSVLQVLRTNPGELPFHPRFGLPVEPGDTWTASVDEGLIIAELIQNSIRADGRYSFVIVRSIVTTGSSVSIDLLVGVPGADTAIPLSFVSN